METLNCIEINGLLYPQIEITESKPLRKYGRLRRSYLKEHRTELYKRLILTETLFAYLNEVDDKSQSLLDEMIPKYAAHFSITEELKCTDQME